MFKKGGNATSVGGINPPLKWHVDGGKHYLASKIVALMPKHQHYCEPFAGGLSVLLAKDPEGVSEVANDLNGELTNFWSVLQDQQLFIQFKRHVEATPFSEAEFDLAGEPLPDWPHAETGYMSCRQAVAFFVRCRQSLAGRTQAFAPLSRTRTRRGMNEQASAWVTAVDGLPAVHARLRRVVVLNRDALDVIRQQDGPDTLFYLDPPYVHSSRATTGEYGAFEMTEEQHTDICTVIGQCRGKVMISGYPSPLYESQLEKSRGWKRHDFDLPNNSAGGKEKRRMTECVWTNFDPAACGR